VIVRCSVVSDLPLTQAVIYNNLTTSGASVRWHGPRERTSTYPGQSSVNSDGSIRRYDRSTQWWVSRLLVTEIVDFNQAHPFCRQLGDVPRVCRLITTLASIRFDYTKANSPVMVGKRLAPVKVSVVDPVGPSRDHDRGDRISIKQQADQAAHYATSIRPCVLPSTMTCRIEQWSTDLSPARQLTVKPYRSGGHHGVPTTR